MGTNVYFNMNEENWYSFICHKEMIFLLDNRRDTIYSNVRRLTTQYIDITAIEIKSTKLHFTRKY